VCHPGHVSIDCYKGRLARAGEPNPETLALLAAGDVDLEMLDPDIELDVSGAGAWMPADLTAVYWGHERFLTHWQHWLESWRDLQFEIQDVCGVADDVLVLIRNQRQRGRHSGILT
jgi:hypothetical protein